MNGFNQVPISNVTLGGKVLAVKGDVSISVDAEYEEVTSNDLGSATTQGALMIGQNVTIKINASKVNYDVLQAAMPNATDIDGDESAIGFGTSSCVNLETLAKELIITPKCAADAPLVSITAWKAAVMEGVEWTLGEAHEAIEINFMLFPDLTQTVPGTYDREGELFYRVDLA